MKDKTKMSILELADYIGIISFALSGFLIAVHKKFDILGVVVIASVTALGGGILRDVISNTTPHIFTSYIPILLVIFTVLFAVIFKLHKIDNLEGKSFFVLSDTLGLVSFAISGAISGLDVNFNFFGVLLLAMLTATGGGTIRDALLGRTPTIFVSDFYAIIALMCATSVYVLDYFDQLSIFHILILFAVGVIIRLIAYYRKWRLPKLS